MIQRFWDQRQRILIFDDDSIQISIVHAEVKFFFKFLDEENRNNCLKVTDLMLWVCRDWIEFSSQQALEVLTHVESLVSILYSSAFDTQANLLRSLCFALL